MSVEIDTVLVPVDGTDRSSLAVEYALTVADRYDAGVHVLHVIDEDTRRAVQQDAVEPAAVAEGQRAFLEAAVGDTDCPVSSSTVVGFSHSRLTTNPVTVVLDTANNVGADFIVIPRESVREEPTAMLAKVAQYVLSHASQPVLSV